MTTLLATLALLSLLALLVVVVRAVAADGYGQRTPPASHPDELDRVRPAH